MEIEKRYILVTGGAGLIGSFVCRRLLEKGYHPVVFDAFIQYVSPFQSSYQKYLELRFEDILGRVIFERGDTREISDVRRVIMKYRPSIIIHLAALPIADLSFTHTEETVGSIINGTVNVLESIRDLGGFQRFVYASSSMIYGDFLEIPAPEEHPKAPKDIYGGTKLAGEILTETYGRRLGIEYTIVRPSAVYGPTDINCRVIQVFLENVLKGKSIVVYGGNENILDFTYVEDCADGFVLAALSKKAHNQIFNITRGEGRSLDECVSIIKKYFPHLEVESKSMQKNRPRRGALSIRKAKEILGFNPKYSLEDGMVKYIEFYNRTTKI